MSNVTTIYPVSDDSCRTMWLAVIHQALFDLSKKKAIGEDARKWFFKVNPGFITVCQLAGLEPSSVRMRAKQIKDNPKLLGHFHG